MWNKNLRLERSQSKRCPHTGPKVSLCNRATWAEPCTGSHCCALLLGLLLLGNRTCSAIGQCRTGPTHKQPTISELPTGTCPAQLLVSTAMGPTYWERPRRGDWGGDSVRSQWCSAELTLDFEHLPFLNSKNQECISARWGQLSFPTQYESWSVPKKFSGGDI